MDFLILTISGNAEEKENVIKNINMINEQIKNKPNFQYFVYTNYTITGLGSEYKKQDFTYFNEMFYKIKHMIKMYDYLLLLDGDDNFTDNHIKIIEHAIINNNKYYIHNDGIYDNKNYNYNGVNNNNSCIAINTNFIDFDLFLNTKSLSDYLLWLPIYNNNILQIGNKLTYIHNKPMDYSEYKEYMLNRYELRLNDIELLINQIRNDKSIFNPTMWKRLTLSRLYKEYAKYSFILNKNKKYIYKLDRFMLLNHNKSTEWFIRREYNLRYGANNEY